MQIDLVASKNGTTFLVDCKHWKRTVGRGSMMRVAESQVRRADRVAADGVFRRLVPIILTWRDESLFILENGVPVVPIHRLADFILNWDMANARILIVHPEECQKVLTSSG